MYNTLSMEILLIIYVSLSSEMKCYLQVLNGSQTVLEAKDRLKSKVNFIDPFSTDFSFWTF